MEYFLKAILLYTVFSIFAGYFLFDCWSYLKQSSYKVLFWLLCGPSVILYKFVAWIFQSLKNKWDPALVSQILEIYNSIDRDRRQTRVNFYIEDWQFEDDITTFFSVRGICLCFREEDGMVKIILCWHNLDNLDKKIEQLKEQL